MKKITALVFIVAGIFVFYEMQAQASPHRKQIVTGYSRRAPIRTMPHSRRMPPPPIHRHHGYSHIDFGYNYVEPYYVGYPPMYMPPVYSTPVYPVGYYGYPANHVNLGFRVSI